MKVEPVVARFVDFYLASRYYCPMPLSCGGFAAGLELSPSSVPAPFWSVPHTMVCSPPSPGGLVQWCPVDSPIDEKMVLGIERFLKVRLPRVFLSYLTYKCLVDVELYAGSLPAVDPRHPLGWLEWSIDRSRHSTIKAKPWLIPFAASAAGMGVYCFDVRRPDGMEDYPIVHVKVVADPDALRSSEFLYIDKFDGFRHYIEYLCDSLEYENTRQYELYTLSDWLVKEGKRVPRTSPYEF